MRQRRCPECRRLMPNSDERMPLRSTSPRGRIVASRWRWSVVNITAAMLVSALFVGVSITTTHGMAQTYKDHRVIDVLKEFQRQGVRLIFSTRLVRPDMWVIDEPKGTDARQIIAAILVPHGLATRVGPRGVLMVIRASVAGDVVQSATLTSSRSLSGLVRDKGTGQPVAGATVKLDGISQGAVTDDAGAFRFENVSIGRHSVVIDARGYSPQTLTIEVEPEREARITIELVVQPNKDAVLRHQVR